MSAVVSECRILRCRNRNPDGSCRLPEIHINSLTMCSQANTKERQHKPNDYSASSVLRDMNQ